MKFRNQERVTGNFCTIYQEVELNSLAQMQEEDRKIISSQLKQEYESVDSICFIKPHKEFYNWIVSVWLCFNFVHQTRLTQIAKQHLA
jgi:hypothetical protein